VKSLIDSLTRPPPPPPPPPSLFGIKQELAPEATREMKKETARQQLLVDIVNFGQKKLKGAQKKNKPKNEELKHNWWAQNYHGAKVIQNQSEKKKQKIQYKEEQDDDDYMQENLDSKLQQMVDECD